jgi:hypothetical protein
MTAASSHAAFLGAHFRQIATAGQRVDCALLGALVAPNPELIQVFSPAQLLHHTTKGEGHHMRISDIFAMGGSCGQSYGGGCYSGCHGDCRPFETPIHLEGPDFRNDLRNDKAHKGAY